MDEFAPDQDNSLSDIAGEATAFPVRIPDATIKNSSATLAVLAGDPKQAVGNYRALVAESERGGSALKTSLRQSVKDTTAPKDLSAVMSILADKTQTIEAKRAAMEWAQKPKTDTDSSDLLLSKAITQPSGRETVEQEDVRISIASMMEENRKSREEIQGIVNAHGASLNSASAGTVAEMSEAWMLPFTNSISVAKTVAVLRKKQGRPVTIFDFLKDVARPGAANQELIAEIDNLPPAAKAKMAKELVGVISQNSGIIIPSDNHFVQYQRADELLGGQYDDTTGTLDSLSNILDIVGLGAAFRTAKLRAAVKGKNIPAAPKGIPDRIEPTLEAPSPVPGAPVSQPSAPSIFDGARMPVPDQTVARKQADVAALEKEREGLLGSSSGLLDKDQVRNLRQELDALSAPADDVKEIAKGLQKTQKLSYNEALSKAEKQVSDNMADYEAQRARIQSQIDANAEAAKNEQRLAALDAQINEMKKGLTEEPTPLLTKLADAIKRVDLRGNIYTHNPAAPGNVMGFGNPSQARALHTTLVTGKDDEFAEAMFGTTRTDAIAANTVPQVTSTSGTVLARTPDPERLLRAGVEVDPELASVLRGTGSLNYTQAEKAAARAGMVNDFRGAANLTMNDAMSSFTVDGDRIRISAMYGGTEGGFSKADDAVAVAVASLRKLGVSLDDMKLMGRDGVEFVELDSKNVDLNRGEYYIRVDTHRDITPDVTMMDKDWENHWNFFDRVSKAFTQQSGSLTRHLIPSSKLIDPIFTDAASRASDFASRFEQVMLGIANKFAEAHNALPKAQRSKLDDYIKEANFQELPLDTADLISRGFTAEGIEAAQLWRKYWDNHFYLENYDMVRTMSAQGFKKFIGQNGTELYVKPIAKNQNLANVYDASAGRVVAITKADGDNLYNSGGHYARLRRPTVINGETVEHVIVRNNLSEYVRPITDNDQILNYKNGYFQIQYTAPRFVDEYVMVGGTEVRRAIAVAGDSFEAETFAKRMRTQNPSNRYVTRADDKAMARSSDDWWDLQEASGRIAQKHRGLLLQDAAGINHLGDTEYIVDPVMSAIRAARSISGRTIARPFLESAKTRVMAKYGHVFPSNPVTKEVMWPGSIGDIGGKGMQFADDVQNARTMFEYIKYLEDGYVNAIDDFVKGSLNGVSAMLGNSAKKGSKIAAKGERGISKISELSDPASLIKNAVFTMYIALNPIRQLIVQPHQAIRMFAYNPKAALEGWSTRVSQYINLSLNPNGSHSRDARDFFKFVEDSGMLSSVDKHNLVTGALVDAAHSTNVVARNVSKGIQVPRKLGFDAGERMNMLTHLGTVYSHHKALGTNMADKATVEKLYAEARAISYGMNFAGDMPYNQNSLGFVLQFMQIPHKALFQAFDRQIPRNVRLRLIGADVMMFGPPTALLSSWLGGDILPDDPELREVLMDGVEQWGLNKIWSEVSGEKVSVDYTSLNPYDITGWKDFFNAMFSEGGIQEVMNNSAAGGLFLNEAGKVQRLIQSVGRLMNIVEDPMEKTDLMQVTLEAARIASGFANAEKALFLLQTDKRISASGMMINERAAHLEAIAQLFGFGSYDQKQMALLASETYKAGKKQQEAWQKVYADITRYYTDVLATDNADPRWMTAVSGHILQMYKDDPAALQYFTSRFASDLKGPHEKTLSQVMKLSGYVDAQAYKDKIRMANIPEDEKQKVMMLIDQLHSFRKENEVKE